MSPAKKAAAKKTPATKSTAKKTTAKKSTAAKKTTAKKSTAKKTTAKRAPAKVTKKAVPAGKKTPVRKKAAPSKTRAASKKAIAETSPSARRPPVKKTAPVTRPARATPPPEPAPEDLRDFAPPTGLPVAGPLGGPEGGEPYRRRPDTVVVSFEGPGPQRRLTVAFRVILAIPHLILLWLVSIVAILAAVVGWFAALVLGRLPAGLARFLGQYVQYATRVSAYAFYLLTDRYPPFSLTQPDYAVSVEVAPGRLNRAAVFFRIILMIPAAIVANVVQSGFQLAAVFIWLIVLVSGRMPTSLFEALAAVLRYLTRFQAYFLLVTADYPSGLFGDPA